MDGDDRRLVRRLKRRDEGAFAELVAACQGRIFNLCYRMLGSAEEAEELAQDVFLKCFQAIGSFRGDSSIGTWLYRIAMNLCKNRLKYLGRRHHNSTRDIADVTEQQWSKQSSERTFGEAPPRPDHAYEGRAAERRVQTALSSLDEEFRELLVLRDVQGLSYAEMVQITGLAEGTVKSRLHRARTALKRAFDALEGGA